MTTNRSRRHPSSSPRTKSSPPTNRSNSVKRWSASCGHRRRCLTTPRGTGRTGCRRRRPSTRRNEIVYAGRICPWSNCCHSAGALCLRRTEARLVPSLMFTWTKRQGFLNGLACKSVASWGPNESSCRCLARMSSPMQSPRRTHVRLLLRRAYPQARSAMAGKTTSTVTLAYHDRSSGRQPGFRPVSTPLALRDGGDGCAL